MERQFAVVAVVSLKVPNHKNGSLIRDFTGNCCNYCNYCSVCGFTPSRAGFSQEDIERIIDEAKVAPERTGVNNGKAVNILSKRRHKGREPRES